MVDKPLTCKDCRYFEPDKKGDMGCLGPFRDTENSGYSKKVNKDSLICKSFDWW